MLVDSHCHIYMRQFDADREEVIRHTFESDVEAMLSIGVDIQSSRDSVELAEKHAGIFAAVGFHPHDAVGLDAQTLSELANLGQAPKVVAIGEIGLDFYRMLSPRDVQMSAFRRQLELASQLRLPVVIHDRDAHHEIMSALREWAVAMPSNERQFRGVMHCFSGDLNMARECVELGFLISIAGTVTYPNAVQLAEVVRGLPLENLLIETDSPYLTPNPYRTKRNEPANVRLVAERIAQLKGVGLEDVALATTRNAAALFDLNLSEPPA